MTSLRFKLLFLMLLASSQAFAVDKVIDGGAGDDDLRGEAGDDTIYIGSGTDTVTGGLGEDTIIIDGL